MNSIQHQVKIQQHPAAVFRALSTIDGLSSWWTETTTGSSALGSSIEFHFGDHLCPMEVTQLEENKKVEWAYTGETPDWVGTRISFDLRVVTEGAEKADAPPQTILSFGHHDWREANDFYSHCSMKWATFLLSLKQYLETGSGAPFPRDVAV